MTTLSYTTRRDTTHVDRAELGQSEPVLPCNGRRQRRRWQLPTTSAILQSSPRLRTSPQRPGDLTSAAFRLSTRPAILSAISPLLPLFHIIEQLSVFIICRRFALVKRFVNALPRTRFFGFRSAVGFVSFCTRRNRIDRNGQPRLVCFSE